MQCPFCNKHKKPQKTQFNLKSNTLVLVNSKFCGDWIDVTNTVSLLSHHLCNFTQIHSNERYFHFQIYYKLRGIHGCYGNEVCEILYKCTNICLFKIEFCVCNLWIVTLFQNSFNCVMLRTCMLQQRHWHATTRTASYTCNNKYTLFDSYFLFVFANHQMKQMVNF